MKILPADVSMDSVHRISIVWRLQVFVLYRYMHGFQLSCQLPACSLVLAQGGTPDIDCSWGCGSASIHFGIFYWKPARAQARFIDADGSSMFRQPRGTV
jgi:hypothetical protein